MPSVYNHWLVALSLGIAVLVSYTALRLAGRVAGSDGYGTHIWLVFGAIAMGSGIWTMHFVGMLAFSLPIPLAYSVPETLASLALAMLTSGFALKFTSGKRLNPQRLALGALAMGTGIAAMHYLGMAAITLVPRITYDPVLVAVSLGIAICASFAALWLFFHLRESDNSWRHQVMRIAAALVMGSAISGMHYTAMAASRFAPAAFCRGGVALQNNWLAAAIGLFALGLLAVTLVTAVYDAHLQSRARIQAERLAEANADLQHQATHDALTQLPNRSLFLDRLEREITNSERDARLFAVLALDLDRFKVVNDSLGHGAGDLLLIEVAGRLAAAVRRIDTVARTGGDEFLLLLTNIHKPADAEVIATTILAALDASVRIGDTEARATASIGISMYPSDGNGVNTLIAHADEAMYFAKREGRNGFRFFNAAQSVFSRERLDFERDLRSALSLNQFQLHYQPKVDVTSGRMNSVEALLRWVHPTRGVVGPSEFISIAEENGLIFSIGEWVIREACRQARQWQTDGLPFIRIAVNISPSHFRQPRFLDMIQAALVDHDLDPQYLEIELTETTIMNDADGSVQILEELSRMGVLVSIDDFGTGYSSMSYLRRFPIDKLKIDRSFIKDLTTHSDAAAIVKAIISLAHSLQLKVVAEGVETAQQLEHLRLLGCDQFQGFYRSAGVLPGEIAKLVASASDDAANPDPLGFMKTQSKLNVFKRH